LKNNLGGKFCTKVPTLRKTASTEIDLKIFFLDYSGYGDSSGEPSHKKVVQDVISAFKHLCEISPGPHLIYAHSLGTSIAVEANQKLCSQNSEFAPDGIILDAPLYSVRQEILDYPYGKLMQKIYTKKLFTKIVDYHLTREEIRFDTFKQILEIKNPILLLQAEDDNVGKFTTRCLSGFFSIF